MTHGSTHHTVSQQTWSSRAINLLFCAGGIIVCYSAFSIYQEKITRKHYGEEKEHFTYMQALVFVQCAVNTIVAFVAKNKKSGITDNVPFKLYSMCSTSYFLAMLFTSLGMDGVTGAVQDRIRHSYTVEKWSMMFFMNLYSSLFLAVSLTISGELVKFFLFVSTYPFVLEEMVLFAIAGALGQVKFYLIFSVVIFNHPYTQRHMIGTAIVFLALLLDALESRRNYKPAVASTTNKYKPLSTTEDQAKIS